MKLTHSTRRVSLSVLLGAPLALAALLALSALPTACSGSDVTPTPGGSAGSGDSGGGTGDSGGGGGAPNPDDCTVDDDCTFTEIDTEITKPSQCMCLYGCVYLPVSKLTAARRLEQHKKFCKSDADGQGQSCGIDDCVVPGTTACTAGKCVVSSTDPAP